MTLAWRRKAMMSEHITHISELRKRYEAEWGADYPLGGSERPPYIPWLEAKLSKMEEALDIERLAAIEHTQWMAWARTLMDEEPELSASRQDRWQAMMVDYSELPEETKEYDREWARIVIGEALGGGRSYRSENRLKKYNPNAQQCLTE